jgi:hypothetical protein
MTQSLNKICSVSMFLRQRTDAELTHIATEMQIRGDRLGMERAFHVNRINGFHGYEQARDIFHGYQYSI